MARAYSLVPEALNTLANRVRGFSRDQMQHEQMMGELGLADARLDLKARTLSDQNKLAVAKAEQEKYLDEPVTLGIVIETAPIPDAQKKMVLNSIDQKLLNFPTTRRKAMEAFMQFEKERGAEQRHKETMGQRERLSDEQIQAQKDITGMSTASAEKIAGMRVNAGGKDTRSPMQKDVEFISQTKGISVEQALLEWQKSKSLPERIRMFNNEVDALNEDISMMGKEGAARKAQKIEQLRQLYGIEDAFQIKNNTVENAINTYLDRGKANIKQEDSKDKENEQIKSPKGINATSAQPTQTELDSYLTKLSGSPPSTMPPDVSQWDVKQGQQNGQQVLYVKDGFTYRPMTEEEYNYWVSINKSMYPQDKSAVQVMPPKQKPNLTDIERQNFRQAITIR